MGTLVPDKRTPIPLHEGLEALAAAHLPVMGGPFESAECLAATGAQLCLESGNFARAHCYNWQNQKAPESWADDYTTFACDEIFDTPTMQRALQLGKGHASLWKGGPRWRVWLDAGHPWARFRAFATPEEGCAEYLKLIACTDRYRAAWHEARSGSAERFSLALGAAGYYTADAETYTRGLAQIAAKILDPCRAILGDAPHGIDEPLRQHVADLIALTLAESSPDTTDGADTESIA